MNPLTYITDWWYGTDAEAAQAPAPAASAPSAPAAREPAPMQRVEIELTDGTPWLGPELGFALPSVSVEQVRGRVSPTLLALGALGAVAVVGAGVVLARR